MSGLTYLLTGGSGTFGTAFIRYVLDHGAARVISLSRGEHRIAALEREIQDARLECWTGDVRDRDRLRWAFRVQPDVVIHAAALKRIETCERDPEEALKTNVDGTRHVVQEAMLADVPKVLVISSDKACSAEVVYGQTKAAAEAAAIGQNALRGKGRTRISVVRYGNVLGSQGSFLDQILEARRTGASIPITDPDATRFWWSIQDAVRFVGTVLERMQGGEVFIPKIASARVVDLVRAIAPESRLVVAGMRGPEKTHEAMIAPSEASYAWELPDCYILLRHGEPPAGAVKVPDGFTYTSDQRPSHVEAICA